MLAINQKLILFFTFFSFSTNSHNQYLCRMNHFELFDLPVSFNFDRRKLALKYLELQKKYHPDFFVQASEQEKEEALEISTQINKALKILKNEDETIKYVLQLKGLLEEEEKYKLPPEFLMEMMELNEDLDSSSAKKIESFENELYQEVKPVIENYDDTKTDTQDLLNLKEYYYKKKYLQRILDRLDG